EGDRGEPAGRAQCEQGVAGYHHACRRPRSVPVPDGELVRDEGDEDGSSECQEAPETLGTCRAAQDLNECDDGDGSEREAVLEVEPGRDADQDAEQQQVAWLSPRQLENQKAAEQECGRRQVREHTALEAEEGG